MGCASSGPLVNTLEGANKSLSEKAKSLLEDASQMKDTAFDKIQEAGETVKEKAEDVVEEIEEKISSLTSSGRSSAEEAATKAQEEAEKLKTEAGEAVEELGERVEEGEGELSREVGETGEEMRKVVEDVAEGVLEDLTPEETGRQDCGHSPEIWTREYDSLEDFPSADLATIKQKMEEEEDDEMEAEDPREDSTERLKEHGKEIEEITEKIQETVRKMGEDQVLGEEAPAEKDSDDLRIAKVADNTGEPGPIVQEVFNATVLEEHISDSCDTVSLILDTDSLDTKSLHSQKSQEEDMATLPGDVEQEVPSVQRN